MRLERRFFFFNLEMAIDKGEKEKYGSLVTTYSAREKWFRDKIDESGVIQMLT